MFVLVRRRSELGADVVHGQLVGRDGDALLLVAEGFSLFDDSRHGEARPAGPHLEVGESFAERSAGEPARCVKSMYFAWISAEL